jgi:hypothetical protein
MTAVDAVRRRIRGDAAARWGVAARTAETIWVVPFVGAAIVAATRVRFSLFMWITGEDSLLEWTQVIAYLTASVAAVLVASRLGREGRWISAALFALFAIGAFFVAGEEISWGQRLFGIETAPAFREANEQGENTIHNLFALSTAFSVMNLLLGAYGSVGTWLLAPRAASGDLGRELEIFVGPVFLTSWFLLSSLDESAHLVLEPLLGDFTILRFSEWPETCLAVAVAAFVLLIARRPGIRSVSKPRPEVDTSVKVRSDPRQRP